MYNHLVGGVLALSKEQFLKVNGWSNLYWGWGVSSPSSAAELFTGASLYFRLKMTVGTERDRKVSQDDLFFRYGRKVDCYERETKTISIILQSSCFLEYAIRATV
jgi:hypothetical protein